MNTTSFVKKHCKILRRSFYSFWGKMLSKIPAIPIPLQGKVFRTLQSFPRVKLCKFQDPEKKRLVLSIHFTSFSEEASILFPILIPTRFVVQNPIELPCRHSKRFQFQSLCGEAFYVSDKILYNLFPIAFSSFWGKNLPTSEESQSLIF